MRTTLFCTLPLPFWGATGTAITVGGGSVGFADSFGAIGGGGAVCCDRIAPVANIRIKKTIRVFLMRKAERSDEAIRNQIPSADLTSKFRVRSNCNYCSGGQATHSRHGIGGSPMIFERHRPTADTTSKFQRDPTTIAALSQLQTSHGRFRARRANASRNRH